MPLYAFKCECGYTDVVVRRMSACNQAPVCVKCSTSMKRDWKAEPKGTLNRDYAKAILSDSMGVAPSQVAEHRRLHPKIPLTDDGAVVVRNGQEERRIKKELKHVFSNPEG